MTAGGYGEVVSEGQQLSSLVLQVIDELGIFSIFPCQGFLHRNRKRQYGIRQNTHTHARTHATSDLQFKDGCIDGFCAVALEASDDGVEDSLSDGHLFWVVVPRPLTDKSDEEFAITEAFIYNCCFGTEWNLLQNVDGGRQDSL